MDGLRAAGEYADERGVSVALECWTRFETYFLNRLEQAVELWEAIGLTNGGVMGDTFHMNIEEASLGDAIRHAGPHLAHMHLADSNRLPPGYGHCDFREVLRALDQVDYTGTLAFELLPDTADPFHRLPRRRAHGLLRPLHPRCHHPHASARRRTRRRRLSLR